MLTKEEARALVLAELSRISMNMNRDPDDPIELVILDEHTIEKNWGWVFFYSTDRYVETGHIRYALAGNAPFIVNRETGELQVTGTAEPIGYYIAKYERRIGRGFIGSLVRLFSR
jgi:hypothetical protein